MLQTTTRGQSSPKFKERLGCLCHMFILSRVSEFRGTRLILRNSTFTCYPSLRTWIHQSGNQSFSSRPSLIKVPRRKFCSWHLVALIMPWTKPVPATWASWIALLSGMHAPAPSAIHLYTKGKPSPPSSTLAEKTPVETEWTSLSSPGSRCLQPGGLTPTDSGFYLPVIQLLEVQVCAFIFFFPTTKLKIHKGQGLWLQHLL